MTKSHLFMGAAAFAVAIAVSQPAFAQDSAPDASCIDEDANGVCDSDEADTKQIVVTGSRIARPNLESTVPITSIAGESFFEQGRNNVGDTLNDLPQLRSTFAQQNPGLGIGIAGLNLLDLRGLGTQRTLVLVNGRRHVPADILNNAVSPDIGSIPNDLIQRIDIVTGGNSAIYGSDAIAGVVNFVLRKDYDGIQMRAATGITEEGYAGTQYLSGMFGKNFADGRGNITVHGEYSRASRVFASDVKQGRRNENFGVIDLDSAATGAVNGGDGFPDRAYFTDLRSTTIHFRGLIPINQRNLPNARCGNATIANNGGTNALGVPFNCTYFFNEQGRLTEQTGARFGTGINSGINGGNGQTGREGQTLSILPLLQRYNLNLLGRYEFSQAAELFVEAKWARVTAKGNNAGPSFNQGTGGTTDFRERPRLDNPFLHPDDRTLLSNLILNSGCRSDLLVTCPAAGNLTATDIANIGNGSFRFVNSRNMLDVGLRDALFQRDTWRVVAGLRGTFNDDWNYEVSFNYGKFDEVSKNEGFLDRQRFALAMDAGRNPITGQIQCRSQFDPASAVPLVGFAAPAADNAARLAADIAACVPYNPFGEADNRASVAYFTAPFRSDASLSQMVLSGFVSGDLSQLFELPAGPVRFALGAEYRREKANYVQDPFTTRGFTNAVSIPVFAPPTFKVSEAFGELQIPIVKDSFIHELTLSGAGRVAKYQGSVGTVYSYNAGVDFAPIEDVRFRANYSRAVRAPNVSETGFPLVPNFSNGFNDPCNPANITANPNRQANCTADLGALLPNLTNITQSLPIVSGSNPNLISETSDSYTYGVVLRPSFVPGLTVSVDYYDITVNNVIANIGVQTLVNQCYDSATLNNIFCPQFTRWRGPGNGPLGEVPGRILGNSLISAPLNFAARVRRGIDTNVSYTQTFGDIKFDADLIYTHNFENSNFQDPTNPTFETRLLKQIGDPKDEFRLDLDLEYKSFGFGYRMRYIGPMYYNGYGTLFPLNGSQPTDVDAFPVASIPAVWYHDVRFDYTVKRGETGGDLLFYFGIDNLFDRDVPQGAATATGAGTAIYNFAGRSYYAGIRARF